MNKTNFIQTGGWPLNSERLQELQTAFQIFNAFGALAGNLTIISGCETVGSTVKNGFVYINGELLEFREAGLTGTSKVIIIDELVNRAFENGTVKTVYTIRYATFGTATTSWSWTDFKRPMETKELIATLFLKADKTTTDNLVTRLTTVETKLATIAPYAEVNVQSDWNVTDVSSDAYIRNKLVPAGTFLYKGTFGTINPGTDGKYTVSFPSVGTTSYYVFGSMRINGGYWNNSNDLVWSYQPIDATSFDLAVREVAPNDQNCNFDFIIVAR
jgi:hypothetical protein